MKHTRRFYWRLSIAAMVLLSVLTFTPLVIPTGRHEPMLMGMPLTLWTGMLIAFVMVAVTYLGSRVHPGEDMEVRENT